MTARDVIAQALALSEAATDGPWQQRRTAWVMSGEALIADVVSGRSEADAAFIAAARTLLPAFAKALGDVLDEMERPVHLDDTHDGCAPVRRLRAAITAALSEVTP